MRRDAYESQLTPEELKSLYALLLRTEIPLQDAAELAPPWKSGKFAGQKPSYQLLAKIASRLLAQQRNTTAIASSAVLAESAKAKAQQDPSFRIMGDEIFDKVCAYWGQDLLHDAIAKANGKTDDEDEKKDGTRVAKSRVLSRRLDQYLAEAKFKRETCKVFMKWYEDERARQILESREDAASKLETLGKLIYGEEW